MTDTEAQTSTRTEPGPIPSSKPNMRHGALGTVHEGGIDGGIVPDGERVDEEEVAEMRRAQRAITRRRDQPSTTLA